VGIVHSTANNLDCDLWSQTAATGRSLEFRIQQFYTSTESGLPLCDHVCNNVRMDVNRFIQVQITFPTQESALSTAAQLVERRLAACAQILGPIRSVYTWNGNREESTEILLLAKTKTVLFDELVTAVHAQHPYECPQIVALPIVAGTQNYLQWVNDNTQF